MEILAKKYYPYLPVSILLKDKFNSIDKLNMNNSPLLVMHGEKDRIVPFSMGKEIYSEYKSQKYSYFIENDDHMMDFNENLVRSLRLFISNLN